MTAPTEVRILRVLGVLAQHPSIVAHVGRTHVRWKLTGWDCACGAPGGCEHVDAVVAVLDPRVLGATR